MSEPLRGYRKALRAALVLPALLLLAACIESTQPLLPDTKPVFGPQVQFQFISVKDDEGSPSSTITYRWTGTRYESVPKVASSVGMFAAEAFDGRDLLIQSGPTKRQGSAQDVFEYLVARKLADGTYLVSLIAASDADEATRKTFCGSLISVTCRIDTHEALLALARATTAKAKEQGLLAIRLHQDEKK